MACEEPRDNGSQEATEQEQLELPPGVPPLRFLYFYVAGSCNLACRHCWISPTFDPSGSGGPFLKLEHAEKAIREAKPLGLRAAKLTGGEPMLHPDFRELALLIDAAALEIVIETNATLIDEQMASFIAGLTHRPFISTSLDGADAETHDGLRAVPGSYDQAVAGIRVLVEVGFHPQVICTLHRGNVDQTEAVIEEAAKLGCGSVKFNLLQEPGRGARFSEHHGLSISETVEAFSHVDSVLRPKFDLEIHFDIPMAFWPIRHLVDGRGSRCSLHRVLGMLASGETALCGIGATLSELTFGHIEK